MQKDLGIQHTPIPKVGIGVMIFKAGKVLLGERRGSHGAGEWAFPGGHLDYMESFEQCARRETREECGIEIEQVQFQFLANLKKYAPKHYVHIGIKAEWKHGEPKVLESDKCLQWGWFALEVLPTPLFESCILAFESYRRGTLYFDA